MEMNGLEVLAQLMPIKPCDGSAETPCIDQIKTTIAKVARAAGYDKWTYTQFSCVDASQKHMPSTFFSTIDQAWQQRYMDNEYHKIDPVVRCSDISSNLFLHQATWEQCKNIAINDPIGATLKKRKNYIKEVNDFYDDAASYGYRSGLIMSMSPGLDKVTYSVASKLSPEDHDLLVNDKMWRTSKAAIILIHQLIDLTTGCATCGKGEHVNFCISEPEVKWLQAALDSPFGTNYELAARHAKSTDTLKTQIGKLRQRLGLPSTANPFLIALYCKRNGLLPESPLGVITIKDKTVNLSHQEGRDN